MKKIWFITGISSGLGKAMAETIIEKGEFVIGSMRNKSQIDNFNDRYGHLAEAIQLDLYDHQSIDRVIQKIIHKYGRIDVIVNNAGSGFAGAIEEASIEEIKQVMDVNFYGTLKLTQAVLPYMRKAGSGHIIQISSHAGIKSFAGFGIYNASKYAVEGFSEALAEEVNPLGIGVTIVEPGPFRTQFAGKGLLEAQRVIDQYINTAGAFRKKLRSVDGKQEGDAFKAAQVIYDHIHQPDSSLRLPLGRIPLKTIQMKIDQLSHDLVANKNVAKSVIYSS